VPACMPAEQHNILFLPQGCGGMFPPNALAVFLQAVAHAVPGLICQLCKRILLCTCSCSCKQRMWTLVPAASKGACVCFSLAFAASILIKLLHTVGCPSHTATCTMHCFLPQTRPQGACGSCLEIECTGPRCNKNVTTLPVVITDSCNWDCNATNINMHVFAFEQLAPLKYGRTTVRYRCGAWLPSPSCW
jgi:hypothetical protein